MNRRSLFKAGIGALAIPFLPKDAIAETPQSYRVLVSRLDLSNYHEKAFYRHFEKFSVAVLSIFKDEVDFLIIHHQRNGLQTQIGQFSLTVEVMTKCSQMAERVFNDQVNRTISSYLDDA
jgi:hypothetical protein